MAKYRSSFTVHLSALDYIKGTSYVHRLLMIYFRESKVYYYFGKSGTCRPVAVSSTDALFECNWASSWSSGTHDTMFDGMVSLATDLSQRYEQKVGRQWTWQSFITRCHLEKFIDSEPVPSHQIHCPWTCNYIRRKQLCIFTLKTFITKSLLDAITIILSLFTCHLLFFLNLWPKSHYHQFTVPPAGRGQ